MHALSWAKKEVGPIPRNIEKNWASKTGNGLNSCTSPVGPKSKPKDKAMDPKPNSPPSGPKCKPVEQSYAHATSIDNKQKVEDDPRTLENFVTDDLGSAVATWQHCQVQ